MAYQMLYLELFAPPTCDFWNTVLTMYPPISQWIQTMVI